MRQSDNCSLGKESPMNTNNPTTTITAVEQDQHRSVKSGRLGRLAGRVAVSSFTSANRTLAGAERPARFGTARRFIARIAAVAALVGGVGAFAAGGVAHADVNVLSGFASTTVRCESSTLSINGMVVPIDLDGTVFVKPTVYRYSWSSRVWVVVGTPGWTQVSSTFSITKPGLPESSLYVKMDYAFGTSSGFVYSSEWITGYQHGAYQALPYCNI
jgi:hypothetical protein